MEPTNENSIQWAGELDLTEDDRVEAIRLWTAIQDELPFIDKRLTEIDEFGAQTDALSVFKLNQAKVTLQDHIGRIDKHSDAYMAICGNRPLPRASKLSDRNMFDIARSFKEPVTLLSLSQTIDVTSNEVNELTRAGFEVQYLDDGANSDELGRSMRALEPTIIKHLSTIRFGLIAIQELAVASGATDTEREIARIKSDDWEFSRGQLQGLKARFDAEHLAIQRQEGTAAETTVSEDLVDMWESFRESLAEIKTLHAELYILSDADGHTFDLKEAKATIFLELAEAQAEVQEIAADLWSTAQWLPKDMTSLAHSFGLSRVQGFPTLSAIASSYQDALRGQYGDHKQVQKIRQVMLEGNGVSRKDVAELRRLIESAQARFSLSELYFSVVGWSGESETEMAGMKLSDATHLLVEWREFDEALALDLVSGCAELLRTQLPASLGLDADGNRSQSSSSRHGKGKAAV